MYFLGVDFGGGSCKATLLNAAGNVEAEFSAEYPTEYTQDGGAEQQPEMWLRAALDCITILRAASARRKLSACVFLRPRIPRC